LNDIELKIMLIIVNCKGLKVIVSEQNTSIKWIPTENPTKNGVSYE
jgi:hypothetical protein